MLKKAQAVGVIVGIVVVGSHVMDLIAYADDIVLRKRLKGNDGQ